MSNIKLLQKLNKLELNKINVSVLNVEKPVSSDKIIYSRDNATSKFHNSNNIRTGGFYKHCSLLLNSKHLQKLFKNEESV